MALDSGLRDDVTMVFLWRKCSVWPCLLEKPVAKMHHSLCDPETERLQSYRLWVTLAPWACDLETPKTLPFLLMVSTSHVCIWKDTDSKPRKEESIKQENEVFEYVADETAVKAGSGHAWL